MVVVPVIVEVPTLHVFTGDTKLPAEFAHVIQVSSGSPAQAQSAVSSDEA